MKMKISSIDRMAIISQTISENRLITKFRQSDIHPAGVITCRKPTKKEQREAAKRGESMESETVTRLGFVFMDEGEYAAVQL